METKFDVKQVTIIIDQTEMEREDSHYYLRAIAENSPVSSYGTATEIGQQFGQMLSNTIAAMTENNCKIIIMEISWK